MKVVPTVKVAEKDRGVPIILDTSHSNRIKLEMQILYLFFVHFRLSGIIILTLNFICCHNNFFSKCMSSFFLCMCLFTNVCSMFEYVYFAYYMSVFMYVHALMPTACGLSFICNKYLFFSVIFLSGDIVQRE